MSGGGGAVRNDCGVLFVALFELFAVWGVGAYAAFGGGCPLKFRSVRGGRDLSTVCILRPDCDLRVCRVKWVCRSDCFTGDERLLLTRDEFARASSGALDRGAVNLSASV